MFDDALSISDDRFAEIEYEENITRRRSVPGAGAWVQQSFISDIPIKPKQTGSENQNLADGEKRVPADGERHIPATGEKRVTANGERFGLADGEKPGPANGERHIPATGFIYQPVLVERSRLEHGDTRRPVAALPLPAQKRAPDPIREKFFTMRSLASGSPFSRKDANVFYKQAKYMENYSDNYQGRTNLSMYYPCYQYMGYEQLRTYFSWRTKARRGDIMQTSPAYVFLHMYELLSGIGAASPQDGLDRLLAIWRSYRKFIPALDGYIYAWFKDYHIFNDLPGNFLDFVRVNNFQKHYPEIFLFDYEADNLFKIWNGVSTYDATKSKYYQAGNEGLFINCFSYTLKNVNALCEKMNVGIETIFSLGTNARFHWYPFQKALYFNRPGLPDRTVKMPGGEVYYRRGGRWTVNTVEYDSERKELAGYFIKKMEACLRRVVNYRHTLKVSPGMFVYEFEKQGIPFDVFDEAIEGAVRDFHKNLNRTVVTVDRDSLSRIRAEAMETQDKLTVADEKAALNKTTKPVKQAGMPDPLEGTDGADGLGITADWGEAGTPDSLEYPDGTGGQASSADWGEADAPDSQDGWAAFLEALSDVELSALGVILHGGDGIKAFADTHNIMLEVLMDGVNEKAADLIGDNILDIDENICIYDEYIGNVMEMIG